MSGQSDESEEKADFFNTFTSPSYLYYVEAMRKWTKNGSNCMPVREGKSRPTLPRCASKGPHDIVDLEVFPGKGFLVRVPMESYKNMQASDLRPPRLSPLPKTPKPLSIRESYDSLSQSSIDLLTSPLPANRFPHQLSVGISRPHANGIDLALSCARKIVR